MAGCHTCPPLNWGIYYKAGRQGLDSRARGNELRVGSDLGSPMHEAYRSPRLIKNKQFRFRHDPVTFACPVTKRLSNIETPRWEIFAPLRVLWRHLSF
jgi:hypothetical protein